MPDDVAKYAFPRNGAMPDIYSGMTLRDWFAGQAIIGMANAATPTAGYFKDRARKAYAMADEMLAERDRK